MTVFVVCGHGIEYGETYSQDIRVFATKELAESYVSTFDTWPDAEYSDFSILELEVIR